MDANRAPQLSVVVVTHALSHDLLALIEQLRVQGLAKSLELVIVTSSARVRSLDPDFCENFFSLQIVEVPDLKSMGQGKAAGVKAARAPLVVFSETHCRVTPDWAKALIETHGRRKFAAVGPVVFNANPDSTVSWAGFLVFYGPWMRHRSGKNMNHLPGNQSCYRREILMAYGQDLADVLEAESLLHWDLIDKGYQLRLEPKATVGHINLIRLYSLIEEHYLAARIFASLRTRQQSAFKRFVYTIGSPLIPLIRLRRLFQEIREASLNNGILWKALTPTIINLCVGAAGEMAGYALGIGKARQRLVLFEAVRESKPATQSFFVRSSDNGLATDNETAKDR
ncbi:MAG: glycosyltransferase family 2 protein [Nitrospinales bacterium]|jgi:GT2 family glycosyltransferase